MREQDLILDPTQYAYVQDATTGRIKVFVGPMKESLSNTDSPVVYDGNQFIHVRQAEAKKPLPVAKQGDYIILFNPGKGGNHHPGAGKREDMAELDTGKQVVIPGPDSFALWPGQTARVLQGHQLRTNEYLIAEVVDELEAQANWDKMVVKTAEGQNQDEESKAAKKLFGISADELVTGRRLIIKGTEVSFFIPPTGIRVIEGEKGDYVRDAVTLETLEYCILVDENGEKRYERGPQVVFPRATEHFVKHKDEQTSVETRKFRAIELNDGCGLYIKVVADYKDDLPLPDVGGEMLTEWAEGKELFITGKEQRIYFPRPEHASIKYAEGDGRIFAIAIPKGDGRYILDRVTGEVKLVLGPKMYLPDPRKEVVVRRVLDADTCGLWFPGNTQALGVNAQLAQQVSNVAEDQQNPVSNYVTAPDSPQQFLSEMFAASPTVGAPVRSRRRISEKAAEELLGDVITRKSDYTPPRSLVLDTKYDGAVTINVWTGYAVMVVSKVGEREVVVGPKTKLLEYDQYLERMALSTGKPKTTDVLYKTVYLRVINNKVGDVIKAETADFVPVEIKVSYRADFEGDPEKWFDSENYVKLLCDHARSLVRSEIKKMKLHEFISRAPDVVRNTLLGVQKCRLTEEAKAKAVLMEPGNQDEASANDFEYYRDGLFFPENGMRVNDVEVLATDVVDSDISELVEIQRRDIVSKQVELARDEEQLRVQIERERINRASDGAAHETWLASYALREQKREMDQALTAKQLADEEARANLLRAIESVKTEIERDKQRAYVENARESNTESERHVQALDDTQTTTVLARAEAFVKKIAAVSPDLIAALQVHGDKVLAAEMVEGLGAVAAITGDSVDGVFKKLLHGSVVGDILQSDGSGAVKGGIAKQAVERAGLRKE